MIQIRNYKVLESLMNSLYHPILIDLTLWACHRYSQFIVTVAKRFPRNENDLHGTILVRAIDFCSRVYDNPQKVVEDINTHWQYDPAIPEACCAILRDSILGEHIHLQVSSKTLYRGG